jgi:hypothetical protein
MLPNESEKPHGLDDVTKKLYSRDEKALPPHRTGVLHKVQQTAATVWNSERQEKMNETIATLSTSATHTSFFKKFFIASGIFFLVALTIGAYLFFAGGRSVSAQNVSINILGNAFTPGGEPLPLTLELGNRNTIPLQLVDLIVEYPKSGTSLSGNPSDIARIRQPIGTIEAGKVLNHKTSLILYGTEGSTKQIKFTLEFHVPGSNAVFQQEKLFSVTISSAPIALSVSAPNSTTPGQEYTATVTVLANTTKSIPSMVVRVEYPTGFKFKSATPSPTYLSNVWSIGTLTPGKPVDIKINGTFSGQDGEERSFRVYTGEQSKTDKNEIATVYQSALHTVDLVRPFIEATLVINGQRGQEVVIRPRSPINVEIPWANNLPISVLDAEIKATISGDLIDRTTISPHGGYFNSSQNEIVWNRDTDPTFGTLEPGERGTVGFSFSTFSLYQNNQLADKPTVTVSVSIAGKQPQEGNFLQSVDSFETRTAKITTDFALSSEAYYHAGPFTNTGPLPPKADQKTTYTIKWALTSSANNVKNVVVRAALPPSVHFLANSSPESEDISLDPITGEVVWNVGTVPRGAGLTTESEPKSVYFQVELVPSIAQVGDTPTLVLETKATGIDAFTNFPLTATWREITTRIFNDEGYQQGNDQVTQ